MNSKLFDWSVSNEFDCRFGNKSKSMNEKLFVAEINKLKREKLECNECLEDLKRKFIESESKINDFEEKKNELAYKMGCLQKIKDDLSNSCNNLLRRENGLTLLKQLTALRKQEKDAAVKMAELKLTFGQMKERAKFYGSQANEVRKLIKHMKLASQKLWERIDRLCEQYEQFESQPKSIDYESPFKKLKTNESEKLFEINEKQEDVNSSIKIKELMSIGTDANDGLHQVESMDKSFIDEKAAERTDAGSTTDEVSVYSEREETSVNKPPPYGENKANYKWNVSRREITTVKIVNDYLYAGCGDGTIKRYSITNDDDEVTYGMSRSKTEGVINSRVKSIFTKENDYLFATLDDGFLCCFNLISGELISDYRLESYIVSSAEGWNELILGRTDRNITFMKFTPNFPHLRTLNLKTLLLNIIVVKPLVNKENVKHLLILGKGCKPMVIDAETGELNMTISNQGIHSPAFAVFNGDIICTVFTQTPEALRNKDSFIAFYNMNENYERIKMEFTKGVVTAVKVYEDLILIALLRNNFTRIICFNFHDWKHLWTTFIGYEKVFALDFTDSGIYFGCRNGCVHRIQVDLNMVTCCDDNRCNCGEPFALPSDLRNIQYH